MKPTIIKELDHEFNEWFREVDKLEICDPKYSKTCEYSLGDGGKITGLCITHSHLEFLPLILLDRLTNIEYLNLQWNKLSDLSFIEKFLELKELRLDWNQITEIKFLKKLKYLDSLNLSNNQISDISILKYLKNLKSLAIANNRITKIEPLCSLKGITQIDIQRNNIKNISNIVNLNEIKELEIYKNNITDIEVLKKLSQLKTPFIFYQLEKRLDMKLYKVQEPYIINYNNDSSSTIRYSIDENGIVNGLSITELGNSETNEFLNIIISESIPNHIKNLNLGGNDLNDITILKHFKELNKLYIGENKIFDISVLKDLQNLTELYLNDNVLTDISILEYLKKLRIIDLSNNKIINISYIEKLEQLEVLNFDHNQITNISALKYLTKLNKLNLNNNQITNLPDWICNHGNLDIELSNDMHIGNVMTFYNNPIKSPPLEIIKQGKKAIIRYFKSIKISNNELKIILIGNTTSGKTSLVEYLCKRKYPPEKTTHGISLTIWKPKNYKFTASIWDFGGQEYYHATHRLFLTNNSFYLLLWEKGKNKTSLFDTYFYVGKGKLKNKSLRHFHYLYWLKLIKRQYAPNCTLITVQNKIDISQKEIINQDIVDNFNIKDQYQISVKGAAEGSAGYIRKFNDFEEDLLKVSQDFIKNIAPEGEEGGKIQRYIDNIRKSIRKWKSDFLRFEDFRQRSMKVAKEGGDFIDDFDLEIAIKYLHDTGVILYYGYEENLNDSILKDYVFINPNYVTSTIYKILNENILEHNDGKFDFKHVLETVGSENEAKLFIALMQSPNFELIFKYENSYYASQFLPENNPVIEFNIDSLEFAFALKFPNFFSPSFISRFISRYGIQADKSAFCRTGIMIKRSNIDFYISSDIENEIISVKTTKEGKRHRFIRKIYDVFIEFADGDKNVEVRVKGSKFAPLGHIQLYDLRDYRIDSLQEEVEEITEEEKDETLHQIQRLNRPLEYETFVKGNLIKVDGNGNIILQNIKGSSIILNIKNAAETDNQLSLDYKHIIDILNELKQKIEEVPEFDRRDHIMELIENAPQ